MSVQSNRWFSKTLIAELSMNWSQEKVAMEIDPTSA